MSPDAVQELVYELQVHQIELEMQNEALRYAESATALAEQKYRELYDFAPAGYLTIDRDDIIRDANIMAATLLDRAREELIGQKFSLFLTADCQDTFYFHKREVLRSNERQDCQLELLNPELVNVKVTSQLVSSKQDIFRTILTDVTVMKRLEARLTQLHEIADAANTAKTQFLANMSHEIRTPLNAIIGISHLLAVEQPAERRGALVTVLQTSSGSLHSLVDELLDFTKIETGHIELEIRPLNLRQIFEDVIGMLAVKADEKGLSLGLDISSDLPTTFLGDAYRLRQIFLNLVSNAIKFTDHGTVTISVGGALITESQMQIDIRVIDTGIGIAPDKLIKVFEKFTQADASTTRKFGGTGLGLSIAKQLTELMAGEIEVTSKVGEGSAFEVRLPLQIVVDDAEKTSAHQDNNESHEEHGANPRVLVVDDYEPNILVLSSYLEDLGFSCDACSDGRQAVEQFDKQDYAVIFMDVQMPGMDGLEATSTIRSLEKERGLATKPIVAVSAHIRPADRQRCFDAGMDAYVAKPFSPKDIELQMQRFVRTK